MEPVQCCKGQAYDRMFDAKTARKQLRAYRKKGPRGATKRLLAAVQRTLPEAFTHLDIGGGIGVLQHELAARGSTRTTAVDASAPYLQLLEEAAQERGYADRQVRIEGDFAAVAEQAGQATVVTLDKVICCYPDMLALVRSSARAAEDVYGIVIPHDGLWAHVVMRGFNLFVRFVLRESFEAFVHPHAEIDRVCREEGLELEHAERWHFMRVRLYRRRRPVDALAG